MQNSFHRPQTTGVFVTGGLNTEGRVFWLFHLLEGYQLAPDSLEPPTSPIACSSCLRWTGFLWSPFTYLFPLAKWVAAPDTFFPPVKPQWRAVLLVRCLPWVCVYCTLRMCGVPTRLFRCILPVSQSVPLWGVLIGFFVG